MAEPFLSEIRIFSFNFPPKGWALANGQLLPINQNQPLFSLLGTAYGGNGQTTFGLPDMRGRVGQHVGPGFSLGQTGGEVAHTLTIAEMPRHQHLGQASAQNGIAGVPGITPDNTKLLAQGLVSISGGGTLPAQMYGTGTPGQVPMQPGTIGNAGGSQPHMNMHPYLALNYCIALQGIFPSQN